MAYLSDTNLRAVLIVLITRAGGQVDLTNEELYDAMLTRDHPADGFRLEETTSGLRLSVRPGVGTNPDARSRTD